MNRRLFWEKRTLKKFRIIFESSEIIVGADRKNKYRTFRKDSEQIAFSRREVLEMRFNDLTHRQQTGTEKSNKKGLKNFNDPALGFNFG